MGDNDSADAKGVQGRPLGRGLEDVSHLFLSSPKTRDESTRMGAPLPTPEREPSPASAGPKDTVVLLRAMQITRDRLAAILPVDWSGTLEEGLRTIGASIPCYPAGEIDVLAVDRTSKLTIIDFDTTLNDSVLLRGVGHFDWIVHNTPNILRMYPTQHIDSSLPPRLILLAPHFSPLLKRVSRQLTRPQIQCVRYHAVESPTGPGILFEPVTGE
jgi:hypothetical protein